MAITHAQRKFIRELQQRQARRKYGAFLVEGFVNVGELLLSNFDIDVVLSTEAAWTKLLDRVDTKSLSRPLPPVEMLGEAAFERVSTQSSPSGILAVARTPAFDLEAIRPTDRVLYLDGLNDPGNAGTLLRSAEWFGIDAICSSPDSADWYNPKTVSAARGSLFRLPHLQVELSSLLQVMQEPQLIIADLAGSPSRRFAWPTAGVLLVGSESHGPGSEANSRLDQMPKLTHVVTIAGANTPTESLNAAVAGSILLSDWLG